MARRTPKKERSNLTPFYAILGGVALLGVVFLVLQARGSGAAATEPVQVDIDPAELSRARGIAIGREDAPVVLYEFADFQCGGCAQFAGFMAPLIKERLVDEGLVRYVYYDFPLTGIHPHAFLAARAGRCADDQGRFWEYHDLLYARQGTWAAMGDATRFFINMAPEAGLDRDQFAECLRSDRHAEEVTRNMYLGESLGVNATPTLFVNMKRLPTIPSFSQLEAIVREEAGMAQPAGETAGEAGDDTAGTGA